MTFDPTWALSASGPDTVSVVLDLACESNNSRRTGRLEVKMQVDVRPIVMNGGSYRPARVLLR